MTEFYGKLGPEYLDALNDMLLLDALIYNTDRHYGNFGVIVDSRTNRIIAPAQLFDHGNSVFNLAGEENWEDEERLREYASTLFPSVYEDFIVEAKAGLDSGQRERLRKMLDFELEKMGAYNYSSSRLKRISTLIRERAKQILS